MKMSIDMETFLVGVIVMMSIERTSEGPMFWVVAGVWTFGGLLHSPMLWRRQSRG